MARKFFEGGPGVSKSVREAILFQLVFGTIFGTILGSKNGAREVSGTLKIKVFV